MDDQQFDRLTSHLGTVASSRRQVLALVLGAVLSVLLPGRASRAKCRVVCHQRDGQRVCHRRCSPDRQGLGKRKRKRCRKAGQPCGSFGITLGTCCANSRCQAVPQDQRQFCLCNPDYGDPNRTGLCEPQVCGALGEVCTGVASCCPPALGGGLGCAPILNKGPRGCGYLEQPDPPSRCCLGEGGAVCTGDCDCCGDLACQSGRCVRTSCRAVMEGCRTAQDVCCGGVGVAVCGTVAAKDDLICQDDDTALQCCRFDGQPCVDSCECCGASLCRVGICQDRSSPGPQCTELGETCGGYRSPACCGYPDTQCCAFARCDDDAPYQGPGYCRRVCRQLGETCNDGSGGPQTQCCATFRCNDGVCERS